MVLSLQSSLCPNPHDRSYTCRSLRAGAGATFARSNRCGIQNRGRSRRRGGSLVTRLVSGRGGRSPNPPSSPAKGGIAYYRHSRLEGDQPLQRRHIVEKMPGAGTHRTHQRRQHPKRERPPSWVFDNFAVAPNQPDGEHPLHHAGNMDRPGGNGENMHGETPMTANKHCKQTIGKG